MSAAIDCARALRETIGDRSEIKRVRVEVGRAAFDEGGATIARPIAPIGAQMSLRYSVAVALIDGDVMLSQFSRHRRDADDVWDLIERVEVEHQDAFDTGDHTTFTTRVTIELRNGETVGHMLETPKGGASAGVGDGSAARDLMTRFCGRPSRSASSISRPSSN